MDRMTLDQTAALTGDDSALGRAIAALARAADGADVAAVRREYNALFIGLGRGELLPYASFYLTGFLNEKPLGVLRRDFARLGLARAEGVFEPEDGIASLMESMGAIIVGRFGDPVTLSRQRDIWARHVAPWAGHFFTDLESRGPASSTPPWVRSDGNSWTSSAKRSGWRPPERRTILEDDA